jgi:hypothetical protein
MTIGVRLPPEIDVPALVDALDAWADEARVTPGDSSSPYRASRRTPLTALFWRPSAPLAAPGLCQQKKGTSDMNVLGAQLGLPLVAYGPAIPAWTTRRRSTSTWTSTCAASTCWKQL